MIGVEANAIRDISVEVYKRRLGIDAATSMVERDGEEALRRRAGAYDLLTRVYVDVFEQLGKVRVKR